MKKQSSYQKLKQENAKLKQDIKLICSGTYEGLILKMRYQNELAMNDVVWFGNFMSKGDGIKKLITYPKKPKCKMSKKIFGVPMVIFENGEVYSYCINEDKTIDWFFEYQTLPM